MAREISIRSPANYPLTIRQSNYRNAVDFFHKSLDVSVSAAQRLADQRRPKAVRCIGWLGSTSNAQGVGAPYCYASL